MNLAKENRVISAYPRRAIEMGNIHIKKFPLEHFTVRHSLCGDPRLKLDSLIELATQLPKSDVEYNLGDIAVEMNPDLTPQNGLSPAETIRRIKECRSWLVLKRVEQIPEYKDLLQEALESSKVLYSKVGGSLQHQAFIFVSSPNSVTPFHIDPEHNFLLQILGTKTVHIWDQNNRKVLKIEDLEKFCLGGHRNLPYHESFEHDATKYTLQPGDGLHFPIHAPHWVKNGAEISVSLSVTFGSSWAERNKRIHCLNQKLRTLKIPTLDLQSSSKKIQLADFAFRAAKKLKLVT